MGAVYLPSRQNLLRSNGEEPEETPPVLLDATCVVSNSEAEVQLTVWSFTNPSQAGAESVQDTARSLDVGRVEVRNLLIAAQDDHL